MKKNLILSYTIKLFNNKISSLNFLMLSVLLILLFAQCAEESKNEGTKQYVISTDPTNAPNILMSSLFESIVYVPLETSENTLVGDVTKIQIDNERIYVFQDKIDKALHVHDKKGEFIYKIDGFVTGTESRRYYNVHDFILDENKNTITMIDGVIKKLIIYKTDDGSFVEYVDTEQAYENGTKIGDDYYFRIADDCSVSSDHLLFSHDVAYGQRDSFLYNDKGICEYSPVGIFPFSNQVAQQVLYVNRFMPQIYSLSETGLKAPYIFDPGGKWVPNSSIERLANINDVGTKINFVNSLKENYVIGIDFIAETNSSIILTHHSGIGAFWDFYNKKDKTVKSFRLSRTQRYHQNDIDLGMMLGLPKGIQKDNLIFLLYPNDVLNFHNQILKDKQREELAIAKNKGFYNLIQKIDYYDNPIVVFAKLKEEFR